MRLDRLADAARKAGVPVSLHGDEAAKAVVIEGVCEDSRSVRPADLFVAARGLTVDGSRFLGMAADRGASATLCSPEAVPLAEQAGLPALVTQDPGRACGLVAAEVLGRPADRLKMVGITGTNGKTSCACLLERVWVTAGRSPALVGTIEARGGGIRRKAAWTTPPAAALQSLLAEFVGAGCDSAVLEVSSHALAQGRVAGCSFDVGVFTNLTRDHLDFHADEQEYFDAKALLFRSYLRPGASAVLNQDDPRTRELAAELSPLHDVWTFSVRPDAGARVFPVSVEQSIDGIRAVLQVDDMRIPVVSGLLGTPNLSNLAAVAAAASATGVEQSALEKGLSGGGPVPGRLERVGESRPVVMVDYAHTPDALVNALGAVRPLTEGRVICVFGCGGDRDRGKRPMMAEAAASGSDVVIVTSDNPRSEEPLAIIEDALPGLPGGLARLDAGSAANAASGFIVEPDRRAAIRSAMRAAGPGDTVLVAGKGHEDYQEVRGERLAFDDRNVVREILAEEAE